MEDIVINNADAVFIPNWLDVFISPIRDNPMVQVAVMAAVLLMFLDVAFGVGNAIRRREFSSDEMRDGIAHKCSEIGFVLVGVILDGCLAGGLNLGVDVGNGALIGIVTYICLMEVGSLMEIFVDINPKLKDNALFQTLLKVPHSSNLGQGEGGPAEGPREPGSGPLPGKTEY